MNDHITKYPEQTNFLRKNRELLLKIYYRSAIKRSIHYYTIEIASRKLTFLKRVDIFHRRSIVRKKRKALLEKYSIRIRFAIAVALLLCRLRGRLLETTFFGRTRTSNLPVFFQQ